MDRSTILTPDEYLGAVLKSPGSHGIRRLPGRRPRHIKYELLLNEVVFDFYDRLKSVSKGYASFDYPTDYRVADLVKMQILVNDEPVDALSMLRIGRADAWPRHGGEAERANPRTCSGADPGRDRWQDHRARDRARDAKDVIMKCYGGDATRSANCSTRAKGKKRMRQFGWSDPAKRSSPR